MIQSINDFQHPFFIGVAGTGMSALAQYLQGVGKQVSGSDRYFKTGEPNETRDKLEAAGICCFLQDGSGITKKTDVVVCSTAVEDTVLEMVKAREMNIPVVRRSEMLALIAKSKKTMAVGGTSGKSTTSAMLFDILQKAGKEPSIISGAGLTSLIKQGLIGNAHVGAGDWLVIEADESDGSIVQYHPEIGLLLNVDKDHKEIEVLMDVFNTFKNNSRFFVVNQSHPLARQHSTDVKLDFGYGEAQAGYQAYDFNQQGFEIRFKVKDPGGLVADFKLQALGRHNMENALAATAVAGLAGVGIAQAAEALSAYEGIYRRHQVWGQKNGVWLVDDYAHNPAKCAASIEACQPLSPKVIAWFQPHGYGPTKFLRADFVDEIGRALRPEDEIWMSEIFYAGGTAVKDISAADLIADLKNNGKQAFFVEDRNSLVSSIRSHLEPGTVLLLMGARDPGLENFARQVWESL
jgi:UDP-N-acetylmuramate--alanine ligase